MKKRLLIIAAFVLLLVWLVVRRHPETPKTTELHPAPDFSLVDLSGHSLSLSANRGKVVLLDFWATWCEPCKTEIPHFIEMQNRYGAQGLQIIGISMDDDEQAVRDFQQQFKINYPVAIGNAKLAEQYGGVLGLPIAFVIDRQGRIVRRHIGQTAPEVFKAEIETLLSRYN